MTETITFVCAACKETITEPRVDTEIELARLERDFADVFKENQRKAIPIVRVCDPCYETIVESLGKKATLQ